MIRKKTIALASLMLLLPGCAPALPKKGIQLDNCERDDSRYACIVRVLPTGDDLEIFAGAVRNTVGFDWHPGTDVLWFTDNGRDWMGE